MTWYFGQLHLPTALEPNGAAQQPESIVLWKKTPWLDAKIHLPRHNLPMFSLLVMLVSVRAMGWTWNSMIFASGFGVRNISGFFGHAAPILLYNMFSESGWSRPGNWRVEPMECIHFQSLYAQHGEPTGDTYISTVGWLKKRAVKWS